MYIVSEADIRFIYIKCKVILFPVIPLKEFSYFIVNIVFIKNQKLIILPLRIILFIFFLELKIITVFAIISVIYEIKPFFNIFGL